MNLIRKKVRLAIPYAGAFMKRDDRYYCMPHVCTGTMESVVIAGFNSFAGMRNYIACTCVGAHLLGLTRVNRGHSLLCLANSIY